MIDHRAVTRAVGQKEILEVEDQGEEFTVKGAGSARASRRRIFCKGTV